MSLSLHICHSITPSHCYSVILSLCHSFTLPLCHSVILSLRHSVTPSLCNSDTLTLRHFVTLSFCHTVILSLCYSVTLSRCLTPSLSHSLSPPLPLSPSLPTLSLAHSLTEPFCQSARLLARQSDQLVSLLFSRCLSLSIFHVCLSACHFVSLQVCLFWCLRHFLNLTVCPSTYVSRTSSSLFFVLPHVKLVVLAQGRALHLINVNVLHFRR